MSEGERPHWGRARVLWDKWVAECHAHEETKARAEFAERALAETRHLLANARAHIAELETKYDAANS